MKDLNSAIANLLRDFAAIQVSKEKRRAYARAADAIAGLPAPIESYLQKDGTLRKIPNIGPSSTRIVLEVLQTGTSATIEQAIADSGKAAQVEKSRGLRDGGTFLSHAEVVAALKNRKLKGPTLDDYRGDLQMH